jgi:acetyltransferase-like isoleucine patch superfamily enzyme
MTEGIGFQDKMIIWAHAGMKAFRGLFRGLLLKKRGKMLLVGRGVSITHGRHISCGKWVKFEDFSEIQGLSAQGLHIGDYVTIGRGVMIRPSSYYGIDMGEGLEIGDHSSIGPYGYVGCSGKISIGSNVMIGPKCNLFAENHRFQSSEQSIKSQGVVRRGIVIEDDCWIASGVTVLDGVTIGKGSVIGAGTLVSKDVPPGSILLDRRERWLRQRQADV